MTDFQRDMVFRALRGTILFPNDTKANKILDNIATEDVDAVEAVIDGFIQEERAERFKMLLEICGGRCSNAPQS